MKMNTASLGIADGIALPILTQLPEGCVLFTSIGAGCEPIVRDGDRLVVDVTDREPVEGSLYLRRFTPPGRMSRELRIVEALRLKTRFDSEGRWMLGAHRRHLDIEAALRQGERRAFSDGPFELDGMHHLIVGRVVAIMAAKGTMALEGRTAVSQADSHPRSEFSVTGLLKPSQIQFSDICAAAAL